MSSSSRGCTSPAATGSRRDSSSRACFGSLYYRGGYILSVTPIDGPRAGAAQLLGEFGGYLGRGELLEELVCEHAKPIRCGDAIDAVSRYL